MNIAIDAHGGDFGLEPNVKASIDAAKELDINITLVGKENEIIAQFRKLNIKKIPHNIKIVPAKDIIDMAKEPVDECKTKPNSSIMVGTNLVGEKNADAFISAGNSGAIMVASLLNIGRIKGVLRPAIAVPFPTDKGFVLLLDAGANMDAKSHHLLQFAIMGNVYMNKIAGLEKPKVGILSIGEEETKGNYLVLETIKILKNCSSVNFYGPIEGRDIPFHMVDVVVTDGFTGNIVLKLSEGLAKYIFLYLKSNMKGIFKKIGGLLLKNVFMDLKKKSDPDEFGGALLLGIDGIVLVGHGKSSAYAMYNAIKKAKNLVERNIISNIKTEIEKSIELANTSVNGENNE